LIKAFGMVSFYNKLLEKRIISSIKLLYSFL
jgi:hypothetical protein